ncbi:hypothetical protein SAY86_000362 [Trapa natans]|uniref:Uncharacterized protein n=1 Tax=Trapa natans TaxID=22666 RepID=A0AAN7RDV5_TRANT|nr:hypothetical protein SAY86_000362 [Trapa natans]
MQGTCRKNKLWTKDAGGEWCTFCMWGFEGTVLSCPDPLAMARGDSLALGGLVGAAKGQKGRMKNIKSGRRGHSMGISIVCSEIEGERSRVQLRAQQLYIFIPRGERGG